MGKVYSIQSRLNGVKFEWNEVKELLNLSKHNISFSEAQHAFLDKNRLIATDANHSRVERRYYCYGKINGNIATVRFTMRHKIIRIFGAGYWTKGRKFYEKENN